MNYRPRWTWPARRKARRTLVSHAAVLITCWMLLCWPAPSHCGERLLHGHQEMVNSVAFSPNGRLLASGSDDAQIKLWDVATGQEIASLNANAEDVHAVAFSPDGRQLASAHGDGTVRLWDSASFELRATLAAHEGAAYAVAWSPDGQLLATGGEDEVVRLWTVRDRLQRRAFRGPTDAVSSVAFSADGKTLAAGAGDGVVRLWSVATGEKSLVFRGHAGDVYRVAYAPHNANLLASVGEDETIRLWDLSTGRVRQVIAADQGWVMDAQFSPQGDVLATAGGDGSVVFWSATTGKLQTRSETHDHEVYALSISPDGKSLATGSRDQTVGLWDMPVGAERTQPVHSPVVEKSTVAVPRKDREWTLRHDEFLAEARQDDVHVVFLGDSITEGWEDAGSAVWEQNLVPLAAVNFGINGDRTQHLLWRITTGGELQGLQPKAVVLLIGTNNIPSDTPAEIVAGVAAVLKEVRRQAPQARVLLLGLFPRRPHAANPARIKIREVNRRLAAFDDGDHTRFLDLTGRFLDERGELSRDVMPDYLHLSENGYQIWAEAILPTLKEWVDQK